MINLTIDMFKNNFFDITNTQDWKYTNAKPTIMVFSALGWCKPCQQIHPILEELSKEYDGKVNVCEIDIEQQDELTGLFGVRNVPTLIFIDSNGVQSKSVGSKSKIQLEEDIKKLLNV